MPCNKKKIRFIEQFEFSSQKQSIMMGLSWLPACEIFIITKVLLSKNPDWEVRLQKRKKKFLKIQFSRFWYQNQFLGVYQRLESMDATSGVITLTEKIKCCGCRRQLAMQVRMLIPFLKRFVKSSCFLNYSWNKSNLLLQGKIFEYSRFLYRNFVLFEL